MHVNFVYSGGSIYASKGGAMERKVDRVDCVLVTRKEIALFNKFLL